MFIQVKRGIIAEKATSSTPVIAAITVKCNSNLLIILKAQISAGKKRDVKLDTRKFICQ
jgi:hypothetical protein